MVGNSWNPESPNSDESLSAEDPLEEVPDSLFHLERWKDEGPLKTFQCRKCQGREFFVGTGIYFTAVKCVKCLYEVGVHDG